MASNPPEFALFPGLLALAKSLSHCSKPAPQMSQVNDAGLFESSVTTQRGDKAHPKAHSE